MKADGPVSRLLFCLLSEMERNKQVQEIVREESPIKIPAGFPIVTDKLTLTFTRKYKRSQVAKLIFIKKDKIEGLTVPDCKSY